MRAVRSPRARTRSPRSGEPASARAASSGAQSTVVERFLTPRYIADRRGSPRASSRFVSEAAMRVRAPAQPRIDRAEPVADMFLLAVQRGQLCDDTPILLVREGAGRLGTGVASGGDCECQLRDGFVVRCLGPHLPASGRHGPRSVAGGGERQRRTSLRLGARRRTRAHRRGAGARGQADALRGTDDRRGRAARRPRRAARGDGPPTTGGAGLAHAAEEFSWLRDRGVRVSREEQPA